MIVGQGWVSPSEFWQMPPGEIWWLIDSKLPPIKRNRPAAMKELKDMLDDWEAKKKRRQARANG